MTGNRRSRSLIGQILLGADAGLAIELRKTKLGAVAVVSGVISVSELTDSTVLLATHSGRVRFVGEELVMSVFSGRTVEILGKIISVEFSYGKA